MKDSKAYADRVQKWYRTAKKTPAKADFTPVEEPLEAIVMGLLSEHLTERQAATARRRLAESFVDLNDLRVARPDEIAESVGQNTQEIRQSGLAITQALMAVFNRQHNLTLGGLRKLGKRPAKQALEAIEGMSRFAVNYTMLMSLGGHAIPLTATMIEYLKDRQLVHPDASPDDIEGFLEKQISSKEGVEFYAHLRTESDQASVTLKAKGPKKKPSKH